MNPLITKKISTPAPPNASKAYSGKYSFEMREYDQQRGKAAQCLDVSNYTRAGHILPANPPHFWVQ